MRSYDAYQESMMANQRVLARVALKGKPGVISQLVKTAALERACTSTDAAWGRCIGTRSTRLSGRDTSRDCGNDQVDCQF